MGRLTNKLYIVRKYIFAPSAQAAIQKERKRSVDDVWIDEDWRKRQADKKDAIGFHNLESNEEEDDDADD